MYIYTRECCGINLKQLNENSVPRLKKKKLVIFSGCPFSITVNSCFGQIDLLFFVVL